MINIYGKGGHAKMIASLLNESYTFYNDADYTRAGDHPWIIAIGDNRSRKFVANINLKDVDYITVDQGVYVAAEYVGVGVQIAPGAVIQNGVIIKDHTIINTSASVDHDCIIGEYCHIALKIGKNCIIGAGSVVTKNISDNSKAFGNPAKIK